MVIGTLQVLALAIFNPLAGLFLAIGTWQLKYTSQIMLEPLPALMSTIMVLCYVQWRRTESRNWFWLILSGVALGLTAASKYVYCLAAVAVVIDWLWSRVEEGGWKVGAREWSGRLAPLFVWGVISLIIFFAADPYLWTDPIGRLTHSLVYHSGYAQGAEVKRAGYPMWQPFVWLSGSVPWGVSAFLTPFDLFTSLFALFGVAKVARNKQTRVFALWLIIALAFLLWWTTKWPQYILILNAPLMVAAGVGFTDKVWTPLAGWVAGLVGAAPRAKKQRERTPDTLRAIPWLLPGLIALGLLAIYPMIYQGAMSLTNLSTSSLRDGINGGIWRAVWEGITFQQAPVEVPIFDSRGGTPQVRFAGLGLLGQLFAYQPDILFFNVMWVVLSVALQTIVGVWAALLLDRPGVRFKNFWRAILILPWAIPEFVGALVWLRVFVPDYGMLAQALPNGTSLPPISQDINFALIALLVSATWGGFPLVMLAATAGLKLLPKDVFDASALEGVNVWQRLRYITLPLLWPLLAPAIIIRAIFAFNQFYLFYVMNTPWPLVTFASLSYYFASFGGGQYAVSATINVFTVIVLVSLLLWFNRLSKAGEGVTYA